MIEIDGRFYIQTLKELNHLNIDSILLVDDGLIRIDVRTGDGYVRGHHCFLHFSVDPPAPQKDRHHYPRIKLEEKYLLGLGQKAYGLPVKEMSKRNLVGLVGLLSEQLAKTCPLYQTLPPAEDN